MVHVLVMGTIRICVLFHSNLICFPGDMENQAELEEKTRLINQVLELQNTLEGNKTIAHT